MANNLKRSSDGTLLHGPGGHLVYQCAPGRCACASLPACTNCPDATPAQFHVSFVDVVLCIGCVPCADLGISGQLSAGAAINGTYVLTRNGNCAWTAFADVVPASGNLYGSADCSGSPSPITFAIQLVRVSATQFVLQVTDDSNLVLLFDATITTAGCCAGFTVSNGQTACGCGGEAGSLALGKGGMAVVTPC